METSPTFQTDHLYLAAFLVCRGYQVVSVLAGVGNRFRFAFSDSTAVRNSVGEFMSGGLVDARQFSFELLKLKRRIPRLGESRIMRKINDVELKSSFKFKT